MIDPKFNELPPDQEGKLGDGSNASVPAQESVSSAKPRTGLSINDTVASDASLSSGSRGTDTSGVRAGAGAGAGGSHVSASGSGSPAPNVVAGGRGSGTTPVSTRPIGQTGTVDEKPALSNELSQSGSSTTSLNHDEIASHAYRCWHERGCPEGSAEEDWHRAERELRERANQPKTSAARA